MEHEYDLAIIGAGMIGATAAWLAQRSHPEWRIGLIDQSLAGHGTSLFSASLDIPYGHTPLRKRLIPRSKKLFKELKASIPSLPLTGLSVHSFVQQGQALHTLDYFIDNQTRPATDQEFITLKMHLPEFSFPENTVMLTGTEGSRAVRNQIAVLIAESFNRAPNAVLHESTEVLKIKSETDYYQLITNRGNIRTKRLIQATGPWMAHGPGASQALSSGLRVKKIVALHINKEPRPDDPVLHFFDDEAFLMPQHAQGQWLFSFRCDQWDVKPDASKLRIDQADINRAKTVLSKYCPDWIPFISGGRVFCDGYTHNGDPLIIQGVGKGHIMAGAGSGSGFRLGPAIAEMALAQLTGASETSKAEGHGSLTEKIK